MPQHGKQQAGSERNWFYGGEKQNEIVGPTLTRTFIKNGCDDGLRLGTIAASFAEPKIAAGEIGLIRGAGIKRDAG